jgi:hypothetical protein
VIVATVPPSQAARLHDLVANVRAFDSLAQRVWGGDAAMVTLQLDATVIRIDKARRGPLPKLTRELATVQKQGTVALRTLDPGDSALAKDAISSLRTNLAAFRAVLKRLSR